MKKEIFYIVIQDGTLIGQVRQKKNYAALPMYSHWASKTTVYRVKGDFTKGIWDYKKLEKVI